MKWHLLVLVTPGCLIVETSCVTHSILQWDNLQYLRQDTKINQTKYEE